MTLFFSIFSAVYLIKQNADRPTISIDGVEFKLKASASVLTDAGFEITGGETLPGKTWNSLYVIEKDGVRYAYVTLYNTSSSEKPLSECRIGEIVTEVGVSFDGSDKVLLNGKPVVGITLSEAETNFGIKDDGDSAMSTKMGSDTLLLSYYDREADCFEHMSLSCDFGKKY